MSTLTGFILAGGESRRMKRDKCFLDWHGRPLLDHMTALLAAVSDEVRIVGRQDLPDVRTGLGPVGGLTTALHASRSENNLVVGVDLPLLTKEFLKYFKERSEQAPQLLTVCQIGSQYPLCFGIKSGARTMVDDYIAEGNRNLHGLIEQIPHQTISETELAPKFDLSRLFRNINTPSDYDAALATDKP